MKLRYSLPMYYGASPKLFEFAKQMRLQPTQAESKLQKALALEPFKQYNFRRQHPIATFIADFYSHSLKLVIEVDGGIHEKKEQKGYDKFRDADMQQLGIMVLRFSNNQIMENIETAIQQIENTIQQRIPPTP